MISPYVSMKNRDALLFFPLTYFGSGLSDCGRSLQVTGHNKNVAKTAPAVEGNACAQFMAKDREHGFGVIQKTLDMWNYIPSGKLTVCYWKWPIYSGFSHEKWWFSIVMLVYQRVHLESICRIIFQAELYVTSCCNCQTQVYDGICSNAPARALASPGHLRTNCTNYILHAMYLGKL